tara:strand:+ start:79 stop:252 length:174 start_codon:yes stop_codon:yes gene_type:complete
MLEFFIAALIGCEDVQGILEHVRENKQLTPEIKKEIVQVIIEATPQCELNEGSEIIG